MRNQYQTRRCFGVSGLVLASLIGGSSVARCDETDYQKRAKVLEELGDSECPAVPLTHSSTDLKISGSIDAGLSKALKALANLGVTTAVEYQKEESKGILEKDLAAIVAKGIDCKIHIFDTMVQKLFPGGTLAMSLTDRQILGLRNSWPPNGHVVVVTVSKSKSVADLASQFLTALPSGAAILFPVGEDDSSPPLPPDISVVEPDGQSQLSSALKQAGIPFTPIAFSMTPIPPAMHNPYPVLILSLPQQL